MLKLARLGGSRSARYYTEIVATGIEDYYAGRGEAPGEWLGGGAAALGLSGRVDAQALEAVMDCVEPGSGEQLRRPIKEGAVTGFDLTFSAPKSVSVLFGVGDEDVSRAVRDAHEGAVREALGYIEREACATRRGRGGARRVPGDGFVAGAFRHRTSRAEDLQLHTHVVAANMTRGPDGRWSALDGSGLYHHAKAAGYLYQAALRARLSDELGLEWSAVSNGTAEVTGIPVGVREHFSTRRAEIVAYMAEHAMSSDAQSRVAALATRAAKGPARSTSSLREAWQARAAEHGLGPAELAEVLGRTERQAPTPAELADLAERLAGPGGLTRQSSAFDRRHVIEALAAAHHAGAPVDELERLADQWLQSDRAVPLDRNGGQVGAASGERAAVGGARYSTPEMLASEQRLIAGALARQHATAALATPEAIARATVARATLAGEQAAMVEALCSSGAGVQVVRAAAGTGKTFALDCAREAWQASGVPVIGCALSGRAAAELRDGAGLQTSTIARLRSDLERGWGLSPGSVLIVDEAGMVDTRQLAALAEAVHAVDGKLVLVGDDRQLPEIQAGGAFRGLAERLGALELHENRRQEEAWERAALTQLREGAPSEWARAFRERGRVTAEASAEETRRALVGDWWEGQEDADGPEHTLMLALRREDVGELNGRARALMRAAGRLGEVELHAAGRAFAAGDRVLTTVGDRRVGVLNGSRGRVEAVDEGERALDVRLDDGHTVRLPAEYLEAGHLDHGYASTGHRAQGMTVQRAYVLGGEETYREWGYTALSRHRQEARFYLTAPPPADRDEQRLPGLDEEQAEDPMVGVVRALGRSRAKELALDEWEGHQDVRGVPTAQLAEQSSELTRLLESFPLEAQRADGSAVRAQEAAERAREAEERLAATDAQREELGRLERRRARELDERLEQQRQTLAHRQSEADQLAHDAGRAGAAGERWMQEHGAHAAELAAGERELSRRRERERDAALRAATVDPPEHVSARIGPRPDGPAAQHEWERAARAIEDYRLRYEQPPELEAPPDTEPGRAAAWQASWQQIAAARDAIHAPADSSIESTAPSSAPGLADRVEDVAAVPWDHGAPSALDADLGAHGPDLGP